MNRGVFILAMVALFCTFFLQTAEQEDQHGATHLDATHHDTACHETTQRRAGQEAAHQGQTYQGPAHQGAKKLKYLNDATQENVIFPVQESVVSQKSYMRRGILIKRPKAKATVLICHGYMCDKYDVSFLHVMFKEYNSLSFDFRAHGEDRDGQCCTFGRDESYDVVGAAQFIKSHPDLKKLPLIVYGFSMGAAASIIAQAREKNLFDAMILDCPFDSTDKLIERGINQLKISLFGYEMPVPGSSILKTYAYNPYVQSLIKQIMRAFTKIDTVNINTCISPVYPEEAIKYVTIPCFFIGCVNDDKAPEEAVLAVYKGAKGFKRCWIDREGVRHFDTIFRQMHKYFYKVDSFIRKVLDGSYLKKKKEKITKDRPLCYLSAVKEERKLII